MKKIVSMALAVTMLCLAFAGCGGNSGSSQGESQKTPESSSQAAVSSQAEGEKAGGKVEEINIWTDETNRKDIEEALLEEFNETIGKEKGVKGVLTYYGADYQQMLTVAVSADKAPEVMKLQGNRYNMFDAGQIIPFEDLPGGDEIVANYSDYLVEGENIIRGKTYSIPICLTTMKLIYNKDLFREVGIVDEKGEPLPPKTLEEMVEDARIITEKGDGQKYGFITAGAADVTSKWEMLTGGSRTVADNSCGWDFQEGKFNFSEFLPFFEAILQMREEGSIFPGYEQLQDAAQAQFAEGNIGMKFEASWAPGNYASVFPAKCDWGVAELPTLKEGDESPAFSQVTLLYSVGSSAEDKLDAAAEIMRFYYSDDFSKAMYEGGKYIPIRQEAMEGAIPPDIKGFAEYADASNVFVARPTPDSYLKLEGDSRDAVIRNVINGSVDPKEALLDIDARYNTALEKAVEEGLDLSLYTLK